MCLSYFVVYGVNFDRFYVLQSSSKLYNFTRKVSVYFILQQVFELATFLKGTCQKRCRQHSFFLNPTLYSGSQQPATRGPHETLSTFLCCLSHYLGISHCDKGNNFLKLTRKINK